MMRINHQELEEKLSRHPDEETLDDYYHGRLKDVEHVTVQCHLIDCDDCVRVFKDVIDFVDSAGVGHAAMSRKEIGQVWTNVSKGIKSDYPAEVFPSGSQSTISFARWMVFTAAAVALVLLVTVGAWVIRVRQDNNELAAQAKALSGQLEEVQKDLNSRIEQLEKASVQQSQPQETVRDVKPNEGRVVPFGLNVPVHNVYSTAWAKRSGEENEVNRIKLLPGDKSVVLILVGESEQGSSKYEIEITDPRGVTVRQNERLLKNSNGNFVISLSREFLRPGTHRIRLRGQGGNDAQQISEYIIKVE